MWKSPKFVVGSALLVLVVLTVMGKFDKTGKHLTRESKASVTVSVTNLARNSGGTGVILSSTDTFSIILTNRHVCGVVVNGGYVITDDEKSHMVVSFIRSKKHDLCEILVYEDLRVHTDLAKHGFDKYDDAIISGHPMLMPTIVLNGHAASIQTIFVQTIRDRSAEEKTVDSTPFEAQMISDLVQPGNSGSPVFNKEGELVELIFAGAGDLGYGWAVPYNYVYNFINTESFQIGLEEPTMASMPAPTEDDKARAIFKYLTSDNHARTR